MKITVVGIGYVGLSVSILLAQKHHVIALDSDKNKVEQINNRNSFIKDNEIEKFLRSKDLDIIATEDKSLAYKDSKFIIIATPTNYDEISGSFDTSSVEKVIKEILSIRKDVAIIIKSTVPVGFTDELRKMFKYDKIYFSPEFLRETSALYDNLFPSRIIVGGNDSDANLFADTLADCSKKNREDIPILYISSKEAECVKLFSNTYLAMRISFINELDTYSEVHQLNARNIIQGMGYDDRIGNYYNNPSFGYGGYCLPKDTQQLLKNFKDIPNEIIKAVVDSNKTRKQFIANSIIERKIKTVGIYRLVMKKGSDNFRESAILDIIKMLKENNINIVVYEPYSDNIDTSLLENILIEDLENFKRKSELIIANRVSIELDDVMHKVYSRDLFHNN